MPEDVLRCPLCGSNRSRLFDRRDFRGRPVVNRLCGECGLVYQSPRMTAAESEAFYAQEYRLVYGGSAEPTARDRRVQQARAEWLLTFARPLVPAITVHLDIGCSLGILLQRFAAAYHCRSAGIEPGEAHRACARQGGLSVYASLEALEQAEEPLFDLISLAHVLEHLPAPVEYLAHLRTSLLSPQGWLLLEVPNLYAHDCFEVAHLVSFSAHTLRQTLLRAGYEIVRLKRHGHPRSMLVPYYITVLARPHTRPDSNPAVRPERGVGIKRKAGLLRRRLLHRLFPKKAWQELE